MTRELEQKVESLISPVQTFVQRDAVTVGFMFFATVIAMLLANSRYSDDYFELVNLPVTLEAGRIRLEFEVRRIVNDGLMTFFFLLLGLEIKRELLVGELQDARFAISVIAAAVGGMCVPGLIYYVLNRDAAELSGWGIPMATDTAFALGVLLLLGNRIPTGLKAFLVAFAIIDDIGAIAIIAVFYTDALDFNALWLAIVCLLFLVACNVLGLRYISIYFLFGFLLWCSLMFAGVHAAVAGVLVAAAVPARPRRGRQWFVRRARQLAAQLEAQRLTKRDDDVLSDPEQHKTVEATERISKSASTPLQRWESSLQFPVLLGVLPLFALTNAGIPMSAEVLSGLVRNPVAQGIVLGLVVGKVVGISLFTWLAVRSGLGQLTEGLQMRHVTGVAILGGMGFTMSIYIADLSFASIEQIDAAKIAVLLASVLSGVAGYLWLRIIAAEATLESKPATR